MPYIEAGRRKNYDQDIDRLVAKLEKVSGWRPGEINYCLSRIIWGLWEKDSCYEQGNELIGLLECVKQEFYQRMLGPYEDEKRADNGDIV